LNDNSEPASTPSVRPRAELLHALMLPDFEKAERIGEFWGYPESRAFWSQLLSRRTASYDGAPLSDPQRV